MSNTPDLFGEPIPRKRRTPRTRGSKSEVLREPFGDGKNCRGCGQFFPFAEFSWNANKKMGRKYRCSRYKACKAKSTQEWLARPGNHKRSKLKRYGMTTAQYDAMFLAQGGACAICGATEMPVDSRTKKPYDLAVDHDHVTGKVRALLCPLCNNGLGCFRDEISRLHAAIVYLEKHASINLDT